MAEAFDPAKYLAEKSQVAQGDMRTPPATTEAFDPAKYLAEKGAPAKAKEYNDPTLVDKSGYSRVDLKEVLPAAGQLADLPGGGIRTGLASAAGLLTGHPNFVTPDDLKRAAVGQAPTTDEYLERAGVPEGRFSPGGEGNPFIPSISLRKAAGFAGDVITDPFTALAKGEKAIRPIGDATQGLGKTVYKSGLKNLDMATARSGKDAVSDLLMANRVSGSSEQVFKQMDALGQQLLQGRNDILKKATRAGAEVDMNKAVKSAQSYVDELRKTDNPELREAVGMLQARIDDYLGAAAKEPKSILRELPVSREQLPLDPNARVIKNTESVSRPGLLAYDAPTLSAPASGAESFSMNDLVRRDAQPGSRFKYAPNESVLRNDADRILELPQGSEYVTTTTRPAPYEVAQDMTERVPGPTPLQTSAWKTTAANRVGDKGYELLAKSNEGRGFNKALASGLREATEESVAKTIGPEAATALKEKNAQLGSLLASDEKAYAELEKEARRMGFTSVDGMLATHPYMLLTKKAADMAKTTAVRTKVGLLLDDLGKSGLLDIGAGRGLINKNKRRPTPLLPDSKEPEQRYGSDE